MHSRGVRESYFQRPMLEPISSARRRTRRVTISLTLFPFKDRRGSFPGRHTLWTSEGRAHLFGWWLPKLPFGWWLPMLTLQASGCLGSPFTGYSG